MDCTECIFKEMLIRSFPCNFAWLMTFIGEWASCIDVILHRICTRDSESCYVPMKSKSHSCVQLPWPDTNSNLCSSASICCFFYWSQMHVWCISDADSSRHMYLSSKSKILVNFNSDLRDHSFCGIHHS